MRGRGQPGRNRASLVVVAAVLLTGGLVTTSAYGLVAQGENRRAAQVMDGYADDEAAAVSAQITQYGDAVRDVAAAVGAQSDLRADDFAAITSAVGTSRLPGAAGIGFVVPATTAAVPSVQRTWRGQGASGLTLRPASATTEHAFVIFEQSFDGVYTVPGMDLAQSRPAIEALRSARQNGSLALSSAFSLLRDRGLPAADRQPSVMFAAPVYTGLGSSRPDVFVGWIDMPVHGQEFLGPTLVDRGEGSVRVSVSDHGTELASVLAGGRVDAEELVRQRTIVAGSRRWELTVWPTARLEDATTRAMSRFTLAAGAALTLMLGLLTGVLAGSRTRALLRVDQATAALRSDIARREHIEAQLREREQELHHLAFHDALTGLANRTLFYDRLTHALATHARAQRLVAVLFIDLDGFKQVNDEQGHAAGDVVLSAVAERLRTTLRTVDTVARFGGDEFAILLEGLNTPDDARVAAERVITDVQAPIEVAGTLAHVSASVGIAISHPGAATDAAADALIREADAAMYRAKNTGKNRYVEA